MEQVILEAQERKQYTYVNTNDFYRCEALDFTISKSQKKILKRMSKFLRNELINNDEADTNGDQDNIGI